MAERVFLDVEVAIGEFLAAVDVEMAEGMGEASRIVADEAAARHPYTNRTGRLQARTVPGRVTGLASRGRVTGEVIGDTRYGSFVDQGTSRSRPYPFLEPALVRKTDAVEDALGDALERAAARAWGAE